MEARSWTGPRAGRPCGWSWLFVAAESGDDGMVTRSSSRSTLAAEISFCDLEMRFDVELSRVRPIQMQERDIGKMFDPHHSTRSSCVLMATSGWQQERTVAASASWLDDTMEFKLILL